MPAEQSLGLGWLRLVQPPLLRPLHLLGVSSLFGQWPGCNNKVCHLQDHGFAPSLPAPLVSPVRVALHSGLWHLSAL